MITRAKHLQERTKTLEASRRGGGGDFRGAVLYLHCLPRLVCVLNELPHYLKRTCRHFYVEIPQGVAEVMPTIPSKLELRKALSQQLYRLGYEIILRLRD